MSDTMTIGEVSKAFRVSTKTVVRWTDAGKIPSFRTLGGHRRFRRAEVERLIASSQEDRSQTEETLMDIPDVIDTAIEQMTSEVRQVNAANGWFDDTRTFGDGIALIHTEVSEAFDAYRSHGFADATATQGKPIYGNGEDVFGNYTEVTGYTLPKPEGVGSECADILIRLLDECDRQQINLAAEYRRKIAYNRQRGYRHGGKRL